MESESFNYMTIVIPLAVVCFIIVTYYFVEGVLPGSKLIVQDPVSPDTQDPNQARFMFFYTTWCPHCKSAQQPWASLKELLKSNKYTYGGKTVFLEEVNSENDKGKAALYKINAYPTFKLETTEKLYEMQGKPSTASFRAFLISALGPEKIIQ
jgi:thiol-disulfide isomerase/thioredoxin